MREFALTTSLMLGALFVGIAIVEMYDVSRALAFFAVAFLWFRYAAYIILKPDPRIARKDTER